MLFGWRAQFENDIGSLNLDCTSLSTEAIAKEWNRSNLHRVRLKGATVDERFFGNLQKHEKLGAMQFEDCNLTSGVLISLSRSFDLVWLEFSNCNFVGNSLGAIKNMRNLIQISVTDCSFNDQHLQSLHGSRIMTTLKLVEKEIPVDGILALRQANPSWKIELPVRQQVRRQTGSENEKFSTLNEIPSIVEISKVEGLCFSGMHISDAALSIVKDASNLESLVLENCSITDDGLQSLQGLGSLQLLILHSVNVSGPGFQYVPANIKELQLTSELDIAWNHLDRFAQLETLHVRESRISEDDLRTVQRLKHLKSLIVNTKDVEGDGLQHLPSGILNNY